MIKLALFAFQRVHVVLSFLSGPLLNSLKERSRGIREGEMSTLPSFFSLVRARMQVSPFALKIPAPGTDAHTCTIQSFNFTIQNARA